jgi:segregation and condensation protein A
MAATLLQIKSQLLLPRPEPVELDDDATNVDPREALVRRLLEYQRYKEAARELGGRELVDRDVFRRPSRAEELEREAGPPELVPLELFHLLRALQTLLQDRPAEAVQEITPDRLTVRQCMTTIADHLRTVRRTALLDLVYLSAEAPTRLDIVVTFMAILELARLRIIRVSQDRLTARDLFIERAIEDWDPSTAWLDEAEEPR